VFSKNKEACSKWKDYWSFSFYKSIHGFKLHQKGAYRLKKLLPMQHKPAI